MDFSQELKGPDGKVIPDELEARSNGGLVETKLTLGRAASHALSTRFPDDQNTAGDALFRRGYLGAKIYHGGIHVLKAEEIAEVKKFIAKMYGPIVIYAAWQLLDAADIPAEV